tara:strand:- start:975 stop:1169 length:195 start_codon:yes stop_codon:yes gene_type:complete
MSNTSSDKEETTTSMTGMIIPLVIIIIEIYALYLAFKCKGGFGGFLAACCCPIFYVPYKLIKKC